MYGRKLSIYFNFIYLIFIVFFNQLITLNFDAFLLYSLIINFFVIILFIDSIWKLSYNIAPKLIYSLFLCSHISILINISIIPENQLAMFYLINCLNLFTQILFIIKIIQNEINYFSYKKNKKINQLFIWKNLDP